MKKKKIIIIILVVLLVLAAIYFIVGGSNKGIEVSIIEVGESSIVKTVEMSGSVYANDNQEIQIPMGIKVKEVYFGENEPVKKGDIIAVLDSVDLNLKLEKAQISLAQVETDLKNPGSKVAGTNSGVLSNDIEKVNEVSKEAESDFLLTKEKPEDLRVLLRYLMEG